MKKKWTLGLTLLAGIALAGGVLTAVSAVEPLDVKAAAGDTYTKVLSSSELVPGDEVIFVSENGGQHHVISTTASKSKFKSVTSAGTFEGDQITLDGSDASKVMMATVGGTANAYTFEVDGRFLYYGSSGTNLGLNGESCTWKLNVNSWYIQPTHASSRAITYRAGSTNLFGTYATSNINGKEYTSTWAYKKAASTEPSVSIESDSGYIGKVGDTFTLQATAVNMGEGLTYDWTLAAGSETIVDLLPEDGMALVDLIGAGKATINLTVSDTAGLTASTSIEIEVKDVLSVTDAKKLVDNEIAYVKGIAFAKYGEAIFIADEDGTGMQLYTYDPLGVTVGEEVTVRGTMGTYNGGRQLNNPEIIEHTATEKVITPKVLTVSDLTEENSNDYVTIKNLVWQDITNAGNNRNINFYEDGDMSKDLVLFDHAKNTSADAKELFDITVADWTSGVTTVDLSGVYMNFKGTHEIYLTDETNCEVDPLRTYAREFLAADLCDNGVTKPSKELWTTLKTSFEALDGTVQTALMEGLADEKGDVIAQALARYDYILGKYGEVEYENFMLRDVVPTKSNLGTTVFGDNANNTFITIGAVALLVMSGLVVVHFLNKKRRAN